jgi:anti-sigma B factor antagonist
VYQERSDGGPGLLLRFSGELDMVTAPGLRRRLEQAIVGGACGIVVDLTDVTFVDSLSLASLVATKHRLAPAGRLAIVSGQGFVDLMLRAAGLGDVLDLFDGEEAAREFAFGPGGGRQEVSAGSA